MPPSSSMSARGCPAGAEPALTARARAALSCRGLALISLVALLACASGAGASDGLWSELPPPARAGHSAIHDPLRDRMIVFGGRENDVWALSLSGEKRWTRLQVAGTAPARRGDHTAIYDPVRDRMLVFGGFTNAAQNDVWALSLAGTPTWSQLVPSNAPPPARSSHSAIYDPVRDRMLIFGGWGMVNTVWELSLSGEPAWTALTTAGVPPANLREHAAVYDSDADRMLIFGGYDQSETNAVWELSLSGTPTWTRLFPDAPLPPSRAYHAAAYDPAGRRLVVFGGSGTNNDVWALSLEDTSWSKLSTLAPRPLARAQHSMILDPVRGQLVVFGGGQTFNDTWTFTLASPSWTQLLPAGQVPQARQGHSAVYDPVRHRMLVFGGWNGSATRNDLATCALVDGYWETLEPLGSPPPPRAFHSAIYDPVQDRMLVFGGWNGTTRINDVWELVFSPALTWRELAPTGGPPQGRNWHSAVFDPVAQRMLIFGGLDDMGQRRTDLWGLRLAGSPLWTQLVPAGTSPPGRYQHSAIVDPARNRMIVFGGNAGGIPGNNDVWALSLDGATSWSQVSPTGTPPTGRAGQSAIYDPVRDRMVLFAGYGGGAADEMWALQLGAFQWSKLAPENGGPSGRENHSAIYDPADDRMIVFGGSDGNPHNDAWAIDWPALVDVPGDEPPGPPIGRLSLSVPRPQPARDLVTCTLDVPGEMHVRAEILDVRGRVVARIADGPRGTGSYRLEWDGTDTSGRSTTAGVYFVRVTAGTERLAQRIVRIR